MERSALAFAKKVTEVLAIIELLIDQNSPCAKKLAVVRTSLRVFQG